MVLKDQLFVILIFISFSACAQKTQPSKILTKGEIETVKTGESYPLFTKALESAKQELNEAITNGFDVPWPKDMAGGYTHETHKKNYKLMNSAGALYKITKDEKYAHFVKSMLLEYAEMYPKLPIHPTDRSYSTGKLFWQCLNDANWLVYTSQAYGNIYNYLSEETRDLLEVNLFRPYADFLSVGNPKFFNRVHNHSTWGNAAVGMIGFVMKDEELIDRALYGLKIKRNDELAKDNDGGFIYEKDEATAGFFAQLDHAFSPMGYYTEGPYYQRYAMTPFMLFAQAINNHMPELNIFEYREGVLLKAVYALLDQSDQSGQFFPINDAQKGMSYFAASVITAVNIAYGVTMDPQLLSIAEKQGQVLLDHNGFAIAKGISNGLSKPFNKKSIQLTDGKEGKNGALGILRTSRKHADEICLVYKYTSQGLGHGHYDKLSYSLYQGDTEVLQDYGAARWVNIDQKAGGRYLKENFSWAKQTIAHNCLVVDKVSHFGGKYEKAKDAWSIPRIFDVSNPELQMVSAMDSLAYPSVQMQRTFWLWDNPEFTNPLVIDLLQAKSDQLHDFDLPYQYGDHLLKGSFNYEISSPPTIMGKKHGYQHLYEEGRGVLSENWYQFNWFKDNKFYTLSSSAAIGDSIILARLGANDPNFNLRRDALLIHRKNKNKSCNYLSVIESHGSYSAVTEIPTNPYSQIKALNVVLENEDYLVFDIVHENLKSWRFYYCHSNLDNKQSHQIEVEGVSISWDGIFDVVEIKNK